MRLGRLVRALVAGATVVALVVLTTGATPLIRPPAPAGYRPAGYAPAHHPPSRTRRGSQGARRADARRAGPPAGGCPWLDAALPLGERESDLAAALSLPEAISILELRDGSGTGAYEGFVPAIPALCLPQVNEQDGPAGVGGHLFGVTQLPAPIGLAAAFDPSLAYAYARVAGTQAYAKGVDALLGPTVNLLRLPTWGRSFETLGEDPYLTASLTVPEVRAIQGAHVVAVVKHFVGYAQEAYRNNDNVIVASRVLHELYLPAFQAAVAAGAGGIMCSLNRVNGVWACQDSQLVSGLLEHTWGFGGFVRSDCTAAHATAATLLAGVSQAKCSTALDPSRVRAALAHRQVSVAVVRAMALRVLDALLAVGAWTSPVGHGSWFADVASPRDAAVALRVAEASAVLLVNRDHVLPLVPAQLRSVALFGTAAADPHTVGTGSATVLPTGHITSPLAALRAALPARVRVWAAAPGGPSTLAHDRTVAAAAGVAIVVAHDTEHEGADRPSLNLPGDQNALISAVARANPRTIVVLETGGPVLMPWLAHVAGVLETWYPGQEAGVALAALLLGKIDPGGHLPVTFPASWAQTPVTEPGRYPGPEIHFSEGLDIGYRWYDAHDRTPLFPFGYGLSYTHFVISDLLVTPTAGGGELVHARVRNIGATTGDDVVQVYLGYPSGTGEPPRQLRGYARVALAPGGAAEVSVALPPGNLAVFDPALGGWRVPVGVFQVWVGDSSAHLVAGQAFVPGAAGSWLGPAAGLAPATTSVAVVSAPGSGLGLGGAVRQDGRVGASGDRSTRSTAPLPPGHRLVD